LLHIRDKKKRPETLWGYAPQARGLGEHLIHASDPRPLQYTCGQRASVVQVRVELVGNFGF